MGTMDAWSILGLLVVGGLGAGGWTHIVEAARKRERHRLPWLVSFESGYALLFLGLLLHCLGASFAQAVVSGLLTVAALCCFAYGLKTHPPCE